MPTPPNGRIIDLSYAAARIADRVIGSNFSSLMATRFGPGQPIAPTASASDQAAGPRQFQYPVAVNTNIVTPRREYPQLTPFEQLRSLAASYDVASLCIATITDIVSNLELQIVAKNKKEQAAENGTCDALRDWFSKPDKVNDLSSWLTMLIYDQLVLDALTIYPRRAQGGGLWGLEVVDGSTIKPLLDTRGQVAAYQQILFGTPWSNYERSDGAPDDDDFPQFSTQELLYKPRWTRTITPYGFPPTERIIIRVNMALRKQTQDLSRFTDSNIPAGVMSPPDGIMNPEQVAAWEEWWNAKLAGSDVARSRIVFSPWKGNFIPFSELSEGGRYESALDEWMLKVTCAAYGVPPQELGFTADINKATGEIQQNALYRRCIIPLTQWLVRTIFNPIIQSPEYLGQPQLEAKFEYGESADSLKQAQEDRIYFDTGAVSSDELRAMRYPDLEGKAPGVPVTPTAPVSAPNPAPIEQMAKAEISKVGDEQEPPHERERRQWENKLLTWLTEIYGRQAERIRDALREAGDAINIDEIFASETLAILRDILPHYDDILSNAAVLAFDEVPIGVDWDLVNSAVFDLAKQEAQRFASEVSETSKAQTAKLIADWIETGGTMDELIERVGRVWSGPRADVAAITEVTRLFAAGNRAAWQASGVVQSLQWKTANDERVCPVCGPLHNSELALDSTAIPPAHPRCRCWIVPIVKPIPKRG